LVSEEPIWSSIEKKEEHDKGRNGILLEQPPSRWVEKNFVSAVSVLAESRSSALSFFLSSLNEKETRRPNNLIDEESVQNPASAKVATTMESSCDLSSISYLDRKHGPTMLLKTLF
jgi:hypothetical protein